MSVEIDIITCPQWGARRASSPLVVIHASTAIIFHHTAGHHREISNPANESIEEAKRYARDIQKFHMDSNGWIDSGHNFLITRAGHILQGRWLTVSAIQSGHMVHSAHCPGQNGNIGIEHEHYGTEKMTKAQRVASATLQAWIADQYGRKTVLPVFPHKQFYATSCPANLVVEIPTTRHMAAALLAGL